MNFSSRKSTYQGFPASPSQLQQQLRILSTYCSEVLPYIQPCRQVPRPTQENKRTREQKLSQDKVGSRSAFHLDCSTIRFVLLRTMGSGYYCLYKCMSQMLNSVTCSKQFRALSELLFVIILFRPEKDLRPYANRKCAECRNSCTVAKRSVVCS